MRIYSWPIGSGSFRRFRKSPSQCPRMPADSDRSSNGRAIHHLRHTERENLSNSAETSLGTSRTSFDSQMKAGHEAGNFTCETSMIP
jgi:hypothetical protein